jgi:hypothetical protein
MWLRQGVEKGDDILTLNPLLCIGNGGRRLLGSLSLGNHFTGSMNDRGEGSFQGRRLRGFNPPLRAFTRCPAQVC